LRRTGENCLNDAGDNANALTFAIGLYMFY
jgi:hypothetical protein